ncbi:uncharacterized protein BDW47DRAFT_111114 [Aspergillus candidus]|uniref:Secreted protein n=1 Tax=Aspergillus candidus TaxID=41067 RepID=A0A2I2F379_ASPCN|nr:hypothetical protein BDW47DRAFT_111114 [Aspergillus candidus]PLB35056.1 hypothetical protein BDW47DRAFT_111114 [Aspergillus candidus]
MIARFISALVWHHVMLLRSLSPIVYTHPPAYPLVPTADPRSRREDRPALSPCFMHHSSAVRYNPISPSTDRSDERGITVRHSCRE